MSCSIGLNPSKYRLYVFAQVKENKFTSYIKHMDFTISGGDARIQGPSFSSDLYSFILLDEKIIKINDISTITEYKIIDMFGTEICSEGIVDSSNFDISHINLEEGIYYIAINNDLEEKKSYYNSAIISIVSNSEPKRAVFKTGINTIFDYYNDKIINWYGLENCEMIFLKTFHMVSGKENMVEINGNEKKFDLSFLNLDAGSYEVEIKYVKDGVLSKGTLIHIMVGFPFLPAPILIESLKTELKISDVKILKWTEQVRGEKYFINILNSDTGQLVITHETKELNANITEDITSIGNYNIEVFYQDLRKNESKKTVINISVIDD